MDVVHCQRPLAGTLCLLQSSSGECRIEEMGVAGSIQPNFRCRIGWRNNREPRTFHLSRAGGEIGNEGRPKLKTASGLDSSVDNRSRGHYVRTLRRSRSTYRQLSSTIVSDWERPDINREIATAMVSRQKRSLCLDWGQRWASRYSSTLEPSEVEPKRGRRAGGGARWGRGKSSGYRPVHAQTEGRSDMKSAFYTVALGAAMVLTASTASVRAEDRDCTVDLKAVCAGIAPGEGHVRACIQAHMSELSVGCSSRCRRLHGSSQSAKRTSSTSAPRPPTGTLATA